MVSADTDFGTLLAAGGSARPSIILIRRSSGRRVASLAPLLLANLPEVEGSLRDGAIVVLDNERVRVRSLPLL